MHLVDAVQGAVLIKVITKNKVGSLTVQPAKHDVRVIFKKKKIIILKKITPTTVQICRLENE